jgi:hypothetical protein
MKIRSWIYLKKTSWLVVEPTPLKNDGVKVSWDDDIPNIWKNKTCSKPPTSQVWHFEFRCHL